MNCFCNDTFNDEFIYLILALLLLHSEPIPSCHVKVKSKVQVN